MISIIIPTYNEEKTVAKVVLLAQGHVDKVIVCDDDIRVPFASLSFPK